MGLLQKERVLTYPDTPKTILTQRSIYKLTAELPPMGYAPQHPLLSIGYAYSIHSLCSLIFSSMAVDVCKFEFTDSMSEMGRIGDSLIRVRWISLEIPLHLIVFMFI